MTPDISRKEYEGAWGIDEHLGAAVALWRDYYAACEAFDRRVCTGLMGRDGILPATAWERMRINGHAREQHKATMEAAARQGIPSATMERAREIALRESDR